MAGATVPQSNRNPDEDILVTNGIARRPRPRKFGTIFKPLTSDDPVCVLTEYRDPSVIANIVNRLSIGSLTRAVARTLLPAHIRHKFVQTYLGFENLREKSLLKRFNRRPVELFAFRPLYCEDIFSLGSIVLVNKALAPGGVERQVVNMLRALERRSNFRVGLLCDRLGMSPEHDFFKPALAEFGGFVRNAMSLADAERALRAATSKAKYKQIKNSIAWMPSDIQEEIVRFAAEFIALKPFVVHAWQDNVGISATYAATMVGVPRVLTSTRNMRPTNFVWYRPYMELAYREIALCPSVTMINNSAAGAEDYAQWLQLTPNRFVVKRNGLDMTAITRAAPDDVRRLRTNLSIPEGVRIVGSIFRLYEEKRPLLWVKVASEIAKRRPQTHFVLFGDGILRPEIIAMARDYGIDQQFHAPGDIGSAGLGMSLFDVFLLTSKFEGTPNVVLEASSLGVPVVATDGGGTAEAIANGLTGFLVHGDEPDQIADRVVEILDSPQWPLRARQEGPAFVERQFGLDRMIAETVSLYNIPEQRGRH